MRVCRACGRLTGSGPGTGPGVSRAQRCDCHPRREKTWPDYDFNLAVELCRCCGQVALRSGSRWSVWFCAGCLQLTRHLNHALGRYGRAAIEG